MLLLIQVALVLTAATQTVKTAVIPNTVFWPTDLFANSYSDGVVTTLGPANSAEVVNVQKQNSAEIETVSQQQNSVEVSIVQQKQNSVEDGAVPTTLDPLNSAEVGAEPSTVDPFNFAEVTPKPIRINPTVDNNQKITNTNVNSEINNKQAERVDQEGGSGSNSAEPNNADKVISTASGTQPFFPQATKVKEIIKEESGHPANSDNSITVNTASDKQSLPLKVNEGSEQESDKTPHLPINVDEANNVPGIEPILSWTDNQQISRDDIDRAGVEPYEESQSDSIPNSLRDALSQAGVENTIDDPLVEHAKQLFISTWNLEANRLQAPYLEVTEVWPEIGMVYMPTINKMSSSIQNSKSVKAAAEKLKSVWEESQVTAEDSSNAGNHALSVLTDFISAWSVGASDIGYGTFSSQVSAENDNSHFNWEGGDEQPFQIKKPSSDRIAILPPAIKPIRGETPPTSNHPAHTRPAGGSTNPAHNRPASGSTHHAHTRPASGSTNPAHTRPVSGSTHPAHTRPAIRQNINDESVESKEIINV